MTRLAHLVLFCVTLSGCQTFNEAAQDGCIDRHDERPWTQMQAPPSNAEALRGLADLSPGLRGGWRHRRELWYSLPTGEVTLCRLGRNTAPRLSDSGVTYEFGPTGDLTDNGAVWFTTR